jgi:hypothetical protein
MADDDIQMCYFLVQDSGSHYEEEFPSDLTIRDVLAFAVPSAWPEREGDDCDLVFNNEILAGDALIATVRSNSENRLVIKLRGTHVASSDPDIPHFRPLPAVPEDEVPPWGVPFDEAVADLASDGHDVPLARRALELAGSMELAERLLETGQVSEAGVQAFNWGEPVIHFLDGDDAVRAVKGIFDDPVSVQDLKSGFSVECRIPDGQGGVLTFLITPEDADLILQDEIERTLDEFQPGDPFRADLKPFTLPGEPPVEAPMPPPQLPPQEVLAPQPQSGQSAVGEEHPGFATIRADPDAAGLVAMLPEEQQQAIATLVHEFGVPGLVALEHYSDADQDLEMARACLESLRSAGE